LKKGISSILSSITLVVCGACHDSGTDKWPNLHRLVCDSSFDLTRSVQHDVEEWLKNSERANQVEYRTRTVGYGLEILRASLFLTTVADSSTTNRELWQQATQIGVDMLRSDETHPRIQFQALEQIWRSHFISVCNAPEVSF